MIRLFVFGTLKKGFPLHDAYLAGATFLGAHKTLKPYPMLVAGPWFAPMMLDRPGEGAQVIGELYRTDLPRLEEIDAVESVGKPGNFRIAIEVEDIKTGRTCSAFAYVKSDELAQPRHSAHLADYQDHRFIPPWDRKPPS